MADESRLVKMIGLRCPGCGALVNVPVTAQEAKCAMCKTEWKWRNMPNRVTFDKPERDSLRDVQFAVVQKRHVERK